MNENINGLELNPEQLEEISGGVNIDLLNEEDKAEFKRLDSKLKQHVSDANLKELLTYRQKMTRKYGSGFIRNA